MTRETGARVAARGEVAERLEAYRQARRDLYPTVRRAHDLGMGPTEIARLCGLSPLGVRKIIDRDPSRDPGE